MNILIKIDSKYAKQIVKTKYYCDTIKVDSDASANSERNTTGIIYAPFIMCEHTEESLKEYNEFMRRYRELHCCCPVCGSKNYTMTLVGFPLDSSKPEEYKNKNACVCQDCGWKGIAHELVPEKNKEDA